MSRPRARDLGLPLPGITGTYNAITDVDEIEVGCKTLISGCGRQAVRSGVTVIHPRGKEHPHLPVIAGLHSFNGNGELTGSHWLSDSGQFTGPIVLTNTHSVGMAHHATCRWLTTHPAYIAEQHGWCLPVVGETCDAWLNDMNGFHVRETHVLEALNGARSGTVEEGNAGGGTGMICYEFKGGNGTSSRSARIDQQIHTVGAFVQANFGRRRDLTVLGKAVGLACPENTLWATDQGSIIIVIATDAPLVPTQLNRLARRATLGMARTGTFGGNGSGDIFIAFSTAKAHQGGAPVAEPVPNEKIDILFTATVQAVEEAIINALVTAQDMTGYDDHTVTCLNHQTLQDLCCA